MAIQTELTFEATRPREQVGDITLHYNEAGEGDQVLIALHGSGPGVSGWSNFKGNLPVFAEHFRTILVDQPGFGWSDKPVIDGSTITYAARAVKGLMDKLGIERAHLLGNSYGGAVSTRLARDYSETIDKMGLMGPGGIGAALF